MKHIVERLQEKRNIEIAKSILESNGYRVSKPMKRVKESQKSDWKYWEMSKDHKGPWEPPHYSKEYSQNFTGMILPPFKTNNSRLKDEEHDSYVAFVWDDPEGEEKHFDDFESAESWLDSQFASKNESKRSRKPMKRVKESSNEGLRNEILQKGMTLEQAREMYLENIDGNVEEYGPFEESEEMGMYESAARKLKVSLDRVVLAVEDAGISNYWDVYRKVEEGEVSDVVSVSTMYTYTGLATFE